MSKPEKRVKKPVLGCINKVFEEYHSRLDEIRLFVHHKNWPRGAGPRASEDPSRGPREETILNLGDDRSVKIKSLEATTIMKIKWLVLGCIDAIFCK